MLKDYFKPVPNSIGAPSNIEELKVYTDDFPTIKEGDIVFFGLGDQANAFRKHFYKLSWKFSNLSVCDLGDLKHKNTKENINAGLTEVLNQLGEMQVYPIVIGEDLDNSEGVYKGVAESHKEMEYCRIAPALSLEEGGTVRNIFSLKPNKLFNFTLMGHQGYYVEDATEKKLAEMLFDSCRLGSLRNSIFNAEPAMRNAHLLTFDLAALKTREFDASTANNPNGLYAEEACQIMRFAGLSCNLDLVYLHGFTGLENKELSSELLAQMVWFYFQGRKDRIYDIPDKDNSSFTIYRNTLSNGAHEIVFCKSNKTERWWMEIPNPRTDKPFYVACTYNDFLKVSNDEMPDLWWRSYQKVM